MSTLLCSGVCKPTLYCRCLHCLILFMPFAMTLALMTGIYGRSQSIRWSHRTDNLSMAPMRFSSECASNLFNWLTNWFSSDWKFQLAIGKQWQWNFSRSITLSCSSLSEYTLFHKCNANSKDFSGFFTTQRGVYNFTLILTASLSPI